MKTARGLRFQAFQTAFRDDLKETIVEIMAGTPGDLDQRGNHGPEVGLGPCGELRRLLGWHVLVRPDTPPIR